MEEHSIFATFLLQWVLCYCSASCEGSGKQIVDSNAWLRGRSGQKAKEVQKQSRVQQKKKKARKGQKTRQVEE